MQEPVPPSASAEAAARQHRKTVGIDPLPHGDVELRYATNVAVQYTGREMIITFLQAHPPALVDALDYPESIPAQVVSRVVMSLEAWTAAVQGFTQHLEQVQTELQNRLSEMMANRPEQET